METDIALIALMGFVLILSLVFAGWHLSYLAKNFGTKEDRRLYDVTH